MNLAARLPRQRALYTALNCSSNIRMASTVPAAKLRRKLPDTLAPSTAASKGAKTWKPKSNENAIKSTLPMYKLPEAVAIKYTDNAASASYWLNTPSFRSATHVGFDIEWKATMQKNGHPGPVALMQICTADLVLLLHVVHFEKLPPELIQLLESKRVFKLGVNIKNDATKIHKDLGIVTNGLVDLAQVSRNLQRDGFEPPSNPACGRSKAEAIAALKSLPGRASLAAVIQCFLGTEMFKGTFVRRSDWEARPLSSSQYLYAACDAYVAFAAYEAMLKFRKPGAADENVPLSKPGTTGENVPLSPKLYRPGPWDALLPPSPSGPIYSAETKYVLSEYEPSMKSKHGPVEIVPIHLADDLANDSVTRLADERLGTLPVAKANVTAIPMQRRELFVDAVEFPQPVAGGRNKENVPSVGQSFVVSPLVAPALVGPPSDESDYGPEIDYAALDEQLVSSDGSDYGPDIDFHALPSEGSDYGPEIDFDSLNEREQHLLDGNCNGRQTR